MLKPHPQGTLLLVRAQPGSRKQGILGVHADRLKVAVHAAPDKGKANTALIELLAEALHLKRHQLQLIQGQTSQDKAFLISGLTPQEVHQSLASHL